MSILLEEQSESRGDVGIQRATQPLRIGTGMKFAKVETEDKAVLIFGYWGGTKVFGIFVYSRYVILERRHVKKRSFPETFWAVECG